MLGAKFAPPGRDARLNQVRKQGRGIAPLCAHLEPSSVSCNLAPGYFQRLPRSDSLEVAEEGIAAPAFEMHEPAANKL